ncbi:cysteine hydrolase family protein [Peloplasma aerotolerans]|uniref:Cysteine hydrolase family protein n=1 Tax=Peloplasma aerotolerans TaxID=3044389 RepID=A0AAW6UA91_9MOLU|nr:cysteine hydrolase family protein [Mariniplasma sp. M4Ah]MDI6453620.1 cysteine hydrolase family protein [Mariniplasma sp. M4Ah]
MKNTALLVVDMQKALIDEQPINRNELIQNINEMIDFCRLKNVDVIFVRHQDNQEGSPLVKDTSGWQIYKELHLNTHDKIIDKKYNSAFYQTDLKDYLISKSIENIILVGMQTEYCIDATCKSAFDLGYHVYLPKGFNSTFNSTYVKGEDIINMYNEEIWHGFADVIEFSDLKDRF